MGLQDGRWADSLREAPGPLGTQEVLFRTGRERRLERETGIEPATSGLGSLRSTAELLPRSGYMLLQPSSCAWRRASIAARTAGHSSAIALKITVSRRDPSRRSW